jgi:hypothetical protein
MIFGLTAFSVERSTWCNPGAKTALTAPMGPCLPRPRELRKALGIDARNQQNKPVAGQSHRPPA